jgi:hypothetical protein
LENVLEYILTELVGEMHQHGLHPQIIEAPIRQRIQELEASKPHGHRLGGEEGAAVVSNANRLPSSAGGVSARELALAAAERRARKSPKEDDSSRPGK